MKASKIVDTIQNYGAAEAYITLEADFKRFINATYGKQDILKISAEDVVKEYHLKGIVFGNYVTQEERYHFIFKISKQLEALATIAGIKNLGHGNLIIAFGAEGVPRAAAHFNPRKNLINLNRGRKGDYKEVLKGENSFIHEYFNSKYLKKRIELFARVFESAFTYHINKTKSLKKYGVYFSEREYAKNIYLPKNETLKNGYDKQVVKIIRTLKSKNNN